MGSVPRDDNTVPGLIVLGSATGADVVVEGDETNKAINVHLTGIESGLSLGVEATDLDIRNLVAATDIVTVTGGAGQTADVKVTLDGETATVDLGANNDVSLNAGTNLIGYTAPSKRADAFQATITSADATTPASVKAKTADKKIYITDIVISSASAINIQLQDDAVSPAVVMEQMYFPANSIWSKTWSTPLEVATNQDLDVVASGAGNISVTVSGYVAA